MERTKLALGAEEVPLAVILSEMLGGNLDRPEKQKAFNALRVTAHIFASDVGAEVTLVFAGGDLTFYGGEQARPDLGIETDSATLLDLANINITFGIPNYFGEAGRGILRKVTRRELKIKGMFAHPIALTRLIKVMSIN